MPLHARRRQRRIESRPQRTFHVRAKAQRVAGLNVVALRCQILVHVDQHQITQRHLHFIAALREELELSDWPDRHDEYDKRSRAALCVQKLRGHRIRKVTSQRYAVVHDLAATSAALTEPVWWN